MPDEITPQATPIENRGEAEWFPPVEDDASAAPAPTGGIRYIFYGDEGLRAGWSFLLFLLEFGIFSFLMFGLLRITHLLPRQIVTSGVIAPGTTIAVDLSQFVAAALAAWILSTRERRSFAAYGLGAPRWGQFGLGLGWGLVMLGALVGFLSIHHNLVFHGQLLHGFDVVKWGVTWAIAFLGVGLFEEFLTRGYAQFTLARGVAGMAQAFGMNDRSRRVLGFWAAALFFSFIFGIGHKGNPGESPVGLLSAGTIGLVFAFSLWRTGSLWWAVGFHAAWDWAQSFLFGVRDSGGLSAHRLMDSDPQGPILLSGGLTGPEGSIYILAAVALTAVVIAFTLKPQPGSFSADL